MEYLAPSDLKHLAIDLRKSHGMSQKDVAENLLDSTKTNVSNAENNPARRANTLVRIIEALSDFQFAEEPRRGVEHNPNRDFSGEIFGRLRYLMPLLFYFHHYSTCHLLDLQLQFLDYSAPKNEGVCIETRSVDELEAVRFNAGKMDEKAAHALQHLLDEGLVEIGGFDVYERKNHHKVRERYSKNMRESAFSRTGSKYLFHIGNALGVQKSGCWWEEDGEKKSLEDKAVYLTFAAGSGVAEIVEEKFGSVYSKLREERGEDEGIPSNARFV
jgi:transcriptional regulator with XRE-family HTH domain